MTLSASPTAAPAAAASAQPPFWRPIWAEVDVAAFRRNLAAFAARMGARVKVLFVCKANAYGHGAVALAREAERGGAAMLGVSSIEEGALLRGAGIKLPILVLGSLYPFESLSEAARLGLTPTVASLDAARALLEIGRRLGRAIPCHVKVETGMARIGVRPAEALKVLEVLRGAPEAAALEGVYTHFAKGGEARATRAQLKLLLGVAAAAKARGIRVPLLHAANSAAALRFPWARLDMVRPGLALYGLSAGFEPVLSLKARVVFLKSVPAGTPVSYDGAFRARRRTRLATLAAGYADGVSRRLSNRGDVLIRGRRCRIAGFVTMDMLMADVTGLREVHVGDEAVLLGAQGRERVSAQETARLCGAIPYEVACAVSARVPRLNVSSDA